VVHQAGDLDAAIPRQILDTAVVFNVPVDLKRLVLLDRLDNPSAVLPTALELDRLFARELLGSRVILSLAPSRPVVCIEALLAAILGVGVLVQQILALSVVGKVFAEVTT